MYCSINSSTEVETHRANQNDAASTI